MQVIQYRILALLCILNAAVPHLAGDEALSVQKLEAIQGVPSRIAFGSCGHQDKPQPILDVVVEKRPDLFIYLGDNIYGDTIDMDVLRNKYMRLGRKPEFQRLRATTPTIATWDDHDYGWNDAGKEYSRKEESKAIFLDFWEVPRASDRYDHAGIYTAHRFTDGHWTVQVLLLDTRTFRDPLLRNDQKSLAAGFKNDYQPDPSPKKTLLGTEQWKWLEHQLSEPADLRVIGSSIQFGHEYNGWESWTNLPTEQTRMLQLIKKTRANGVIFISGDVHWGEISVRSLDGGYPLHDVTASGLTEEWPTVEPNKFRHGPVVRQNHFGMITVDWKLADPLVSLQVIDKTGKPQVNKQLLLSELTYP